MKSSNGSGPGSPSTDAIFITRVESPPPGHRLAVKDLFDTAGLRTTYGSAIFADHIPARTAEAVRLLEAAGYANVGKANLHEFAYGVTSENPHYGRVPNPLAEGRIAGGSSGGSAANFPSRRELALSVPDREEWGAAFRREVVESHAGLYPERAEDYGDDVRRSLEAASELTDSEVVAARRLRERLRDEVPEALEDLDLLVTPTLPCVAPPIGQGSRTVLTKLTALFNLTGWPALALPCGPGEDGLPASIQLAAPPGLDSLVLAAAAALERALQVA